MVIKWQFESKVIVKDFLNDVIEYDNQLLSKLDYLNKAGKWKKFDEYAKLLIPVTSINTDVWFENWNPFDWSESKYFITNNKIDLLKRLNYWRQTGQFLYYSKKNQIFSV